ncbi:hypothetical protein HW555_008178 [Spodoptera exigua]|uniref:MADF domain-containing protein n=1 Tax=Spodoptera exigua TaxID=7107 RepID=A0A835GBH5_SPOEX|nr:hypothetical protein HW555_008178 [Spodoptera exigua]
MRLQVPNWCNIINKILKGAVEEKYISKMETLSIVETLDNLWLKPLNSYNSATTDLSETRQKMAECQKQWKKLRDCYKKALRLRQYKSGSARKNEKPIKFEKELEFC